ncbi:NACHT, LRR and PYD domains-containing protein 12-like isoform X2 [Pyxicephalus adspersus]|nr:TPA: hypothetical protein GDO54_004816 [Pyxicephalus adspersus]
MAESPLKEWKSKYLASVKEVFQGIEEHSSQEGAIVNVDQRYPRLRPLQILREEDATIPYSGTLLEQAEVSESSDRYSPSRIQDLFIADGSGFVPKTLVLVGPHGIGKTLTSRRIMLDWASGNLYNNQFNFLFYLSGREINQIPGNVNIAGLVAQSSELQCPEGLLKSAFSDPAKVLLIIDGFDELQWTLEDDYDACDDPFQEIHKETFLRCLISKEILSDTSLIITTRSRSLRKLKEFTQSPCSIELLGFSEKDLEKYFHAFFSNGDLVDQAVSLIKDNEVLLALCSVPLICRFVCVILKSGMKDELSTCRTLTSLYLRYLMSLIIKPGNIQHKCLKKLCALANQGILNQKSLFDEEDLSRHHLTRSEITSVFPGDSIFQIQSPTNYSFIHLSVQEFFAALYYILDEEIPESNGGRGDTFLPEVCKGRSIFSQGEDYPYLVPTVRFLFGLLNDQQVKDFALSVGSVASFRVKPAMEKWLLCGKSSRFSLDGISCFYEAQDEDLRSRAFNGQDLVLEQSFYSGTMENARIAEMLYCLGSPRSFTSISLEDFLLRPKDLELLSPYFHGSSKLSFTRCGFVEGPRIAGKTSWLPNPDSKIQELEFHVCVVAPSFFEDLHAHISTSRSLSKLKLSYQMLGDSALKILCDGLCQPGCTLQELTLDDCNLSSSSCEILGLAIKGNRSLHKLDMALNKLEDEGVKFLCEGLKDPGCTLRELRLDFSQLTPGCCKYFRSALMTNRSLNTLHMRDNDLQDAGAKILCEALLQPGCTLKELRLHESNITGSSCEDFRSVLLTNRTLTILDLTYNNLQDSGIKVLCEGLRDPGCTLKELTLLHCEMTQESCEDLRSVLTTNQSLTDLDLTWNNLEDAGVKILCEGLRDPNCILQGLRLYGCDLSSSSLQEFVSVIRENRSLSKLDLAGNKYEDVGVKPLCEALRQPDCTLQEFRVGYCDLTASCAEEFLAVINTNSSLKELDVSFSYEDEEPPADLDIMCQRFHHPACTVEKNETQDGTFIYFKYRSQNR